jgi:predicted nucleic acid-binding protein
MVASLSPWHVHGARATAEIDRRLSAGEQMVLAAPSVVETYSVLTRMPRPQRYEPRTALKLIEANFLDLGELVALDAAHYLELIRWVPERRIAGGSTYDAVVVACAQQARATTILTFNDRHFRPLVGPVCVVFRRDVRAKRRNHKG